MSKDCVDCKYWEISHLEEPCDKCNDTVTRPFFEPMVSIDQVKDRLFKSLDDVQKIIDDAMEKGDRSVHISIVGDGMSLNVYPYKEDDGMGVWKVEIVDPDKPYIHHEYRCSVCNATQSYMHPHCPICGAKMKFPELEGEKDAK